MVSTEQQNGKGEIFDCAKLVNNLAPEQLDALALAIVMSRAKDYNPDYFLRVIKPELAVSLAEVIRVNGGEWFKPLNTPENIKRLSNAVILIDVWETLGLSHATLTTDIINKFDVHENRLELSKIIVEQYGLSQEKVATMLEICLNLDEHMVDEFEKAPYLSIDKIRAYRRNRIKEEGGLFGKYIEILFSRYLKKTDYIRLFTDICSVLNLEFKDFDRYEFFYAKRLIIDRIAYGLNCTKPQAVMVLDVVLSYRCAEEFNIVVRHKKIRDKIAEETGVVVSASEEEKEYLAQFDRAYRKFVNYVWRCLKFTIPIPEECLGIENQNNLAIYVSRHLKCTIGQAQELIDLCRNNSPLIVIRHRIRIKLLEYEKHNILGKGKGMTSEIDDNDLSGPTK